MRWGQINGLIMRMDQTGKNSGALCAGRLFAGDRGEVRSPARGGADGDALCQVAAAERLCILVT